MTQVFLLTAGTPGNTTIQSFPNPGNWNPSSNLVEVVGPGGLGGYNPAAGNNSSGAGGGGGSYARVANMSLTFPVPYFVPSGNFNWVQLGITASTNWNVSSTGPVTTGSNLISATMGQNAAAGAGVSNPGPGGTFYAPSGAGYNGGAGGSSVVNGANSGGGGGGGAAGPHGAGGTGGAAAGGTAGGGGAADGSTFAGPAGAAAGLASPTWDLSHGAGTGGGGGNTTTRPGQRGGNYGGGGGGGFDNAVNGANAGGIAGDGIIVLTYLPLGWTQIFLLGSGSATFPDPGNWNPSSNMVECIGCGAFGGGYQAVNPNGGGGGGGGAYAYATNTNLPFPVSYYLFPQGSAGGGSCVNWGAATFAPITSGPGVSAPCGYNIGGGQGGGGGGKGSPYPYPNGYAGGNGAHYNSVTPFNGGGGGGAGGPHGVGADASANVNTYANLGAAGDAGVTPGQSNLVTKDGYAGTQFNPWGSTIYGSGGGAIGGTATAKNGGNGGNYGGGGGGAFQQSGSIGGNGAAGIIVLTYLPSLPSGARAIIMA